MCPRLIYFHSALQTTPKMNNLLVIFTSVLFAAVCFGACPQAPIKSQNHPLGIINGTDAEDGEFPYVVQLYRYNFFICGGAIIDERWILTAGHCVENGVDSIVYGTNILAEESHANTTIRVKKSYLHPKYYYISTSVGAWPYYDVGVLELEEPIKMNDKAQPLKLADSNDVPFHIEGVLAGWGTNETYGPVEQHLQKVKLQLLNDTECSSEMESHVGVDVFNSVHNICSDNHFKGQCNGDSGSPFVINGFAYGVVSWSIKPCATSPGAYSRITNPEYRSFIKNITGI